jgi:hypothetical protein
MSWEIDILPLEEEEESIPYRASSISIAVEVSSIHADTAHRFADERTNKPTNGRTDGRSGTGNESPFSNTWPDLT